MNKPPPRMPVIGRLRLTVAVPPQLEAAVVEAIREAEVGNRGEVRVHIERRCGHDDARERARELFDELSMHDTRERTGLLLYVALEGGRAAVFADSGIPGGSEASTWHPHVARIAEGHRQGRVTQAIVEALSGIGRLLRQQVPGDDVHGNELPDRVTSS